MSAALALLVLLVGRSALAGPDQVLALRQEYNQVAASIDTLVRLYGGPKLEELARLRETEQALPSGMELVLIFWADDEAEVFLNEHRVSSTRLTPTLVEIPSLYLRESNVLRVHGWDTDRVESGFMAGLYLRDRGGALRQVLVSGEGNWWVGGQPAEERFYAHSQPDIPGAQVIWGPDLFGEAWLETRFEAGSLRQAASGKGVLPATLRFQERRMETDEVIGRLVRLQERRGELEAELERRRSPVMQVRYRGYGGERLAFALGRAGPLAEVQSVAVASRLLAWSESLSQAHRELLFREPRPLKGVQAATQAQSLPGGASGEADRRAEYLPPPERGPARGWARAGRGGQEQGQAAQVVVVAQRFRWVLVVLVAGLGMYLGAAGRQWWRLFTSQVWKR
jgi:hypothetical protein